MKRMLKKSEVLREGYVKGLKKAQSIINDMINEQRLVNEWDEMFTTFDHDLPPEPLTPKQEFCEDVLRGEFDNARRILKRGININKLNYGRENLIFTILHNLIDGRIRPEEGYDALDFMIENGIDVNGLKDRCGNTMLDLAALSNEPDVVEYLLNAGAVSNPSLVKSCDDYITVYGKNRRYVNGGYIESMKKIKDMLLAKMM